MKYISIPTEIEALKWDNNSFEMRAFLNYENLDTSRFFFSDSALFVKPTSSNEFIVVPLGHYVIKEMKGYYGFYPCSPGVFILKYKSIDTDVDDGEEDITG